MSFLGVTVNMCMFLCELHGCFSLFASIFTDLVRIVKMASEPEGIENVMTRGSAEGCCPRC